jgi:hypothetical protein
VSAAGLLLSRAEAHQADLIRQRDQANTGESDKREELRRGIKDRVDTIKAEAETHQKNLEAIREACRVVREQCMVPRSKAEDQRYDAIRQRVTKERDDRQSELDELVKKDRGGVVSLDKDITAAASAVGDAKRRGRPRSTAIRSTAWRPATALAKSDTHSLVLYGAGSCHPAQCVA